MSVLIDKVCLELHMDALGFEIDSSNWMSSETVKFHPKNSGGTPRFCLYIKCPDFYKINDGLLDVYLEKYPSIWSILMGCADI